MYPIIIVNSDWCPLRRGCVSKKCSGYSDSLWGVGPVTSTYTARSGTVSPAVAQKPRDASCLSVASIIQHIERKFRFSILSLRRGHPCVRVYLPWSQKLTCIDHTI